MNVFERMRLAMWALTNSKASVQVMSTWQEGQPAYPLGNFENNTRLGYRRNEVVYACLMTKADAASSAELEVVNPKTEKEIEDNPALALVKTPNEHMTEFDFIALTLLSLDLAGRAYWEKRRNRRGDVIELWPLRPDWMVPIKSRDKFIDHFEFRVPGERPQNIAVEDVLDFKVYDPLDQYNSVPPVTVACRAIDTDNASTDFLNKFFRNGGMPTGILTTKQRLNPGDPERIRAHWVERYAGVDNWLKGPAVLDSDAQYQKVGSDFKEMGLEYLDARQEARICAVLRVPPILVGVKVGLDRSTFANAAEAQEYFWRNMLIPQLKRIRDELQADLLVREFGQKNAEFTWDFSEVSALQEDRDKAFLRASDGVAKGYLTVNMALEEIGEESIGPAGDIFLRPLSVNEVPLKRPDPANQLPAVELPPQQPPPDQTPPQDGMPEGGPDMMPPDGGGKFRKLMEQLAAQEEPGCEDCGDKAKKRRRGKRAGRKRKPTPAEEKFGSVDDDCDLIENELEGGVIDFFVGSRARVMDVIGAQGVDDPAALDLVLWG